MNELVFLKNNQPVTTSLIIADGTGNQHKSVIQLIGDHKAHFERWGALRFSDLKTTNKFIDEPDNNNHSLSKDGRGRPMKVAYLNEQQATFLITLLDKVNEACQEACVDDYKLEVNFSGEFFKVHSEAKRKGTLTRDDVKETLEKTMNGQIARLSNLGFTKNFSAEVRQIVREELNERDRKFAERFEKDNDPNFYIELFQELRKVIDGSEPTQP